MMRTARPLLFIAFLLLFASGSSASAQSSSRLTASEKAAGWSYLFDGKSLEEFRGYQKNKRPAGWTATNGWLVASSGAPALCTIDSWENLELTFEWRVSDNGHGIVYFRISEDFPTPGDSSPGLYLGPLGKPGVGGAPDLFPSSRPAEKPHYGEWNTARLLVQGYHVDYFINEFLVTSYDINSADFKRKVASTKFGKNKEFALISKGPIVIEGSEISLRNVKVRELP